MKQRKPVTLDQVHRFLLGECQIRGRWFGDDPPMVDGIRRRFWWREYLRGAIASNPQRSGPTRRRAMGSKPMPAAGLAGVEVTK